MIVIHGGVAVDPGKVAEVTEAAKLFVAATAAEDGFLEYTLSWDVVEPNRIRLLEAWTTPETSAAHGTQQHTKDWTTMISGAALAAPKFFKYEAELIG